MQADVRCWCRADRLMLANQLARRGVRPMIVDRHQSGAAVTAHGVAGSPARDLFKI